MPESVTHDAATLEALEKAKILDELHDNPSTRAGLFQGIKTIRPQARIPELDTTAEVLRAITPHLTEIGQTREALAKERAEVQAERVRDKAQKALNLSDDEFVEVTKLAEAKKIGDLETAAEFWRHTQRVAEPRSGPETTIELPNIKELWKNPTQFARNEARKVQHEFQILREQGRR